MDLKKVLSILRRTNTSSPLSYLVLALIESGATDTPFFKGLPDEEFMSVLLALLAGSEMVWHDQNLQGEYPGDFIQWLHDNQNPELMAVNVDEVKILMVNINLTGEEKYGFTRLNRLDEKDGEQGSSQTPGAEGQQGQSA